MYSTASALVTKCQEYPVSPLLFQSPMLLCCETTINDPKAPAGVVLCATGAVPQFAYRSLPRTHALMPLDDGQLFLCHG